MAKNQELASNSKKNVCWVKLIILNDNEIFGPEKLKFDSGRLVDIDDIKVSVKKNKKLGNKLQSVDAVELQVYVASALNVTPLHHYDVWDHKVHGGEKPTNPMIVKAYRIEMCVAPVDVAPVDYSIKKFINERNEAVKTQRMEAVRLRGVDCSMDNNGQLDFTMDNFMDEEELRETSFKEVLHCTRVKLGFMWRPNAIQGRDFTGKEIVALRDNKSEGTVVVWK